LSGEETLDEELLVKAFEWLEKAKSDFDDAEYNLKDDREDTGAFLLHQACEKALKALQIVEKEGYDYSHDLLELASDEALNEFGELFKKLNPVYVGTRYPGIEGEIENLDELKSQVGEALEWIEKQLNQ